MKVEVQVEDCTLDTDTGPRAGLEITCPRCGQTVEVFGDGAASAKAGAMMLRSDCRLGESNFYDLPEWVKRTR